MEESVSKISRLRLELEAAREELSSEDEEYTRKLRIVNASDIEKPWKHEKWHASMTRLSRTNRRRHRDER